MFCKTSWLCTWWIAYMQVLPHWIHHMENVCCSHWAWMPGHTQWTHALHLGAVPCWCGPWLHWAHAIPTGRCSSQRSSIDHRCWASQLEATKVWSQSVADRARPELGTCGDRPRGLPVPCLQVHHMLFSVLKMSGTPSTLPTQPPRALGTRSTEGYPAHKLIQHRQPMLLLWCTVLDTHVPNMVSDSSLVGEWSWRGHIWHWTHHWRSTKVWPLPGDFQHTSQVGAAPSRVSWTTRLGVQRQQGFTWQSNSLRSLRNFVPNYGGT